MHNFTKMGVVGLLAVAFSLTANFCRAQDPRELTLSQAVSLALRNSRDVALARARYASGENQARLLRAEFLPNIYTGTAAAYSSGLPQNLSGQPPSLFQLSYSQLVFDSPLRGQVHATEDRAKSRDVELRHICDLVIVRTATSFLELVKVRHSLELVREERSSAQRIAEFTRKRTDAGMALPMEITRTEIALAKIEERTVQLENQSQILTGQLQKLTGLASGNLLVISEERLPEVERPAGDLSQLALENSSTLKEAENERTAREDAYKGQRGRYWPTAELIGQYSVLGNFNNYSQFFKKFQRNSISFGVLVRIPVFNATTAASVALAKTQLSEAVLNLGKLHDDEQIIAQQRISTVAERNAALRVARLELQLAEENLSLLQKEFDMGQAFSKDLDQARLDALERRIAFLDVDCADEEARLALMEITGQLSSVFR